MSALSSSTPLVNDIMASLRQRYLSLNLQYEAAWTESWIHQRCGHAHNTLIEAAKCAMPTGAGWYVLAVEFGTPRELTTDEDDILTAFRYDARLIC
jgi:hypothetical protein